MRFRQGWLIGWACLIGALSLGFGMLLGGGLLSVRVPLSMKGAPPQTPVDTNEAKEQLYILETLREFRTGLTNGEEQRLSEVILTESKRYGLDPIFVMALIKTESTFFHWSISHRGAIGLMQIHPDVGRDIARELGLSWKGKETIFDPYVNIRMGTHYFYQLQRRFEDPGLALAAYNMGPTYVEGVMEGEDRVPTEYAEKVFDNYRHLQERIGRL